jgi:hypothetical protein
MNDFPAPDYAEEINSAYAQGCAGAEAAVAHIVRCGALLIAQKGRMKHGEFMPWVEKHCKFSHDSANHYMRVAANPNYEHARNLSLRQLLDKPKPKPPPPTTPQPDSAQAAKQSDSSPSPPPHKPAAKEKAAQSPVEEVRESDRARFKRLLEKAIQKINDAMQVSYREQLAKGIQAAFDERYGDYDSKLRDREREVGLHEKAQAGALKDISQLMTYDDYKLILSCLHPDKPDRDPARLSRAFQIFRPLDKTVNLGLGIAELRRRHWEFMSRHYNANAQTNKNNRKK